MVGVDLRQGRPAHQQPEQGQHAGDDGVGRDHAPDQFVERGGFRRGVHRRQRREQRGVRDAQHEGGEEDRREDAGALVADAHQAEASRRRGLRAEDGDVGVGGGLQDRETGAEREQTAEEDRVGARVGRGDEEQRAERHHPEADHHPLFEADPAEQPRGRPREQEVGDIESERDQVGLEVRQLAADLEIWDEDRVRPRDEAEDEEQHRHDRERHARLPGRQVTGMDGVRAHARG